MWMGNEISIEFYQLPIFESIMHLLPFIIASNSNISFLTFTFNAIAQYTAHTYDTFPWRSVRIHRPDISKHNKLNGKQYAAMSIDFEANKINCWIWWDEENFVNKINWSWSVIYLWWCVLRVEELMWRYFFGHFTCLSCAFAVDNEIYVRFNRARHLASMQLASENSETKLPLFADLTPLF